MQRVYHPYTTWEDYQNGMWKPASEDLVAVAIEFMSDTEQFGKWMGKVSTDWPFCTEQNLTSIELNRKSWIGQAA